MKIDFDKYKQYYTEVANKIFATPSPSGYNNEIQPVVAELIASHGLPCTITNKGTMVVDIAGASSDKLLGLSAHVDTLGLMVRSINSDGTLRFVRIGGAQLETLDGEYCQVLTRSGAKYTGTVLCSSPSSHVYDDAGKKRSEENMLVRLDENVSCREDVAKLGIAVGDYIAYDPKTVFTDSGYLKSRFIDDKASACCFITIAKILRDYNIVLPYNTTMLFSVYEEVGHGASHVPQGLSSMLAVDMGCIGLDLTCNEKQVSICAKDSSGPYDYNLTSKLIELSKANNIDYAVDVYPHYSSDVSAMYRAGHDVVGALIGTGVHASHGMERTHMDGIINTMKLILLYLGVQL